MFNKFGNNELQKTQTNSVRFLAVDSINLADSGHPGICLSAAPMITELFTNHLNASSFDSNWINRDRFIMSAGHGSGLLYSMLHHMGYDITLNDIKEFRQLDSKTPGHPEFGHTDGVDATSGPLGQGIAQAVGMAIAEEFLAKKFNINEYEVFNHYTYALICDGDLQEGVSYEAMSLAGHLQLSKLILLYDSNNYQLDGAVDDAYSDNLSSRCKSMGWNYIKVNDGENRILISNAIQKAKKSYKPTMIEIKTILGHGTTMENSSETHGSPIGEEERKIAAKYFGYKEAPFVIAKEAKTIFKNIVDSKKIKVEQWNATMYSYKKVNPKKYNELLRLSKNKIKIDLTKTIKVKLGELQATRNHSPEIIKQISQQYSAFIGGSADLKKSTKVFGLGQYHVQRGSNINFGVREFSMASIANGIMLHGLAKAFVSTFFIFSDYAKPAIRLSALQNLPITYIYTHDSIMVGEDGPTHQPIEQLSSLRSIPNHNVIRPADHRETILAYNEAINSISNPTSIVLTRQNLENFSEVSEKKFKQGAYIVKKSTLNKPKLTIVATGSEVTLVLDALKDMNAKITKTIRLVSMPSTFMFDKQSQAIKSSIIPDKTKTLFIEMSDGSFGYKYANHVYSLFNKFGTSAPGEKARFKLKFTKNDIINVIEKLIKG